MTNPPHSAIVTFRFLSIMRKEPSGHRWLRMQFSQQYYSEAWKRIEISRRAGRRVVMPIDILFPRLATPALPRCAVMRSERGENPAMMEIPLAVMAVRQHVRSNLFAEIPSVKVLSSAMTEMPSMAMVALPRASQNLLPLFAGMGSAKAQKYAMQIVRVARLADIQEYNNAIHNAPASIPVQQHNAAVMA